ncbi:hypothetical protein V0R50_19300 [Pseudomonas sp. 148P]|uniref:Uncharacterized protein n=1 Tax=Pseudomonas ulcerans TaxID=3115852 RepID=A0ABU7HUZ2_9PSED|nr:MULTISPECIES: hypothetical protein [unclassified Pseudomonas]MEE1923551.1 hypothetical protein [Pseudomonas sp. 147P]MEE1935382.1 hypothetical protein [Pseudomonas sp. 148P]
MKRRFMLLSLLAALSTNSLAAKIGTVEDIEQVEGIMNCTNEASAKQLAQAWARGGYAAADDFVVEHRDSCSSIPPRESLTYSIDLATAHDGIVKFDGDILENSLWVPLKGIMSDLYAKFGQEPGAATDFLELELFTPVDGLYLSRGVVDRQMNALQFVYLHGGQVHILWYSPETNKVLLVQEADHSSYDPQSRTLVMDQPGTNKRLTYTMTSNHEPLRFSTNDRPEPGKFMPTTSLDRFNNGMLLQMFPATIENPMARNLRMFTLMANSGLQE